MADPPAQPPADLPEAPIDRLVGSVQAFLHVEAAGGIVLLAFTVAALVLANSPWAHGFLALWKTEVGFRWGGLEMHHSLKHWINDALMALFFFVVGLEVKRELVLGELRDPRRAALPFAAAIGGMIVPAAVYLALLSGSPEARGWGIPMATDIAFAVGCLAVLGSRVPPSLRVLLLSLAIVDDIGAILVIAVGYTTHVAVGFLGLGALAIAAVAVLQRLGVRSVGVYAVLGVGVWLCFHESGVHATLAGVILGLLTPARSWVSGGRLAGIVRRAQWVLSGAWEEGGVRYDELRRVEKAAREALSPLERLEKVLHPWVGFVIMPLFAFANAGVPIEPSAFGGAVPVAIAAGLVIGKPAGVLAFSWLAVRTGLARPPGEGGGSAGVGWWGVAAVGVLAGIGFTMSLFIAGLALEGPVLDAAKVGILAGSLLSGVLGVGLLLVVLPRRAPA